AIARSWSPWRSRGRTAQRPGSGSGRVSMGPTGCSWRPSAEPPPCADRIAPMGKLGVSVLNADLAHLADQVKLVEPYADLIHIDVMDAHFVPPLTIGPAVVRSLRPWTDLVLACHLMVERPEHLFEDLAEAGTQMVTFHVESQSDSGPVIRKARDAGMRTGLAVGPETSVATIVPSLEDLDNVIVMSVHPGWGG